jgi:prevent-host-death family protein
MAIKFTEDIRSVTDVKRNTKEILEQIHRTRRPVVVTVNGRADAVLVDAETYQKRLSAERLARLTLRPRKTSRMDDRAPCGLL